MDLCTRLGLTGNRVLLVEPDYYTRFPPLGLLKLASYHKRRGDSVILVRGCRRVLVEGGEPKRVYVTSLFTWAWRPVWAAVRYYKRLYPGAEVWLGGIYASLLPSHAEASEEAAASPPPTPSASPLTMPGRRRSPS